MKKEEIVEKLRGNKEKLKEFGVKRIGIFGSCARDATTEESDVDIVVEFEKGRATFKNVAMLVDYLEALFKRNLLTPDGVESIRIKSVREEIKRETEYVQARG